MDILCVAGIAEQAEGPNFSTAWQVQLWFLLLHFLSKPSKKNPTASHLPSFSACHAYFSLNFVVGVHTVFITNMALPPQGLLLSLCGNFCT
eukprot:scaffold53576_cov13-Tisochrysis_lutea.AAC.1